MKRTLTLMLGLILLFAGFAAWPKLEEKPKISPKEFVSLEVRKTSRERKPEETTGISPEVQRRLVAAGLKTDSFTAVKTETRQEKK